MECCRNKRLMVCLAVTVAVFFGLAYVFQWKPALGAAPFLLFLLCPLMHIFMMMGSGHKKDNNAGEVHDKKSCH